MWKLSIFTQPFGIIEYVSRFLAELYEKRLGKKNITATKCIGQFHVANFVVVFYIVDELY
jgi:hypothetical protein